MATNEAKRRIVETVQLTDHEIRHVTRNASQEADRILRDLDGREGVAAEVRRAKTRLAQANVNMWGDVKDATRVGIGDAFDSATDYQALFDERMFKAAGVDPAYWRQSMLAESRQGIESYISRRENGYTLSDRVYRNQALSKGYVDRAVNNGLLLGKSAAEIANDVRGFISPNVPGGASYAAMRLGRTEVVNAYHQTNVRQMQREPWVERALWNLSGSHPRPDECNEYAEDVTFRGGEPGEWLTNSIPSKPHPQCLCYITPVLMDLDEFAARFKRGEYDNHINDVMGCSSVA